MTRRPSPAVAALLSFVLPGLGQLALGSVGRGLLLLAPTIALGLLAVAVAGAGTTQLLDLALSEGVLLGVLIGNLLFALYRVVAIVDAGRSAAARSPAPTPGSAPRRATAVLVVLVVATIGMHGAVEAVGYQAYASLDKVFADPGLAIPEPSFEPTASPTPTLVPTPTPTPGPTATPRPSPTPPPTPEPTKTPAWAKDGRLNLLLIGSDSGPGRWMLRTDTMIVLSVDEASGRAALFGVPRNMTDVPLPPESKGASPNGRFPGLLNALYVYAMGHPRYFPGGDARGFRAVTGAVQELVGVRLDGVVVVDLNGFVKLVDAIGGLWIDVPERVVDDHYPLENGRGKVRIVIKAGCQKLSGHDALAYARSRHQDSDYGRMERQQLVLVALAHQVDPIALLTRVPELLKIAGDHLWTTVDREDIAGLARLAARIDPGTATTITFAPPKYPTHMSTAWIRQIRRVVRTVFDEPAPEPSASPDASQAPVDTCRG